MEQCCEVNTGLGVEVPAGEEGRGKRDIWTKDRESLCAGCLPERTEWRSQWPENFFFPPLDKSVTLQLHPLYLFYCLIQVFWALINGQPFPTTLHQKSFLPGLFQGNTSVCFKAAYVALGPWPEKLMTCGHCRAPLPKSESAFSFVTQKYLESLNV